MLDRRIYNNFEALRDYCKVNLKDFSKANKNSIVKTYSESEYKRNIKFYNIENCEFFSSFDSNVLKNIDEQYYKKLDVFIENTLRDYSQLYNLLTISTSDSNIICSDNILNNKNLARNIDSENEKMKKKFIKLMSNGDVTGAAKVMLEKKYERTLSYKKSTKSEKIEKEKRKIEQHYNDIKFSNPYVDAQDILAKPPTYAELKKDIQELMNMMNNEEENPLQFPEKIIVNLSRYLADEIFLRVQDKESYVEGTENNATLEEYRIFNETMDQNKYERILPELTNLYQNKSQDSYEQFWDKHV